MSERVSVVGLGKLGLCLAAVLADNGFRVRGVDIDPLRAEQIASGRLLTYEPGLESVLQASRGALTAGTGYGDAIMNTETTMVVVPTPSTESGGFSLDYVLAAIERIGGVLARKRGYHLVVVCSTVMPGSMDGAIRRALEETSGKPLGNKLGLCYNPEFIALGDVLRGLRNPDFVLIGESDSRAGDLLERIQKRICSNGAPVERMTFWNAELAKMAVNSFVTMKMSFANTLAEMCERMPGGDVDAITRAIGRDKRIGQAYLKGGVGYGGPCFPRDNRAFAQFSKEVGVTPELALATDRTNNRQVGRIVRLIEERFSPFSTRIGVLGVTYKPNTNIIESSQSMMVALDLARKGFRVHVYDPGLRKGVPKELEGVAVEDDLDDCLKNSDACILATPWEAFSTIDKSKLSGKFVVDCWRILNGNRPRERSNYVALGLEMASKRPVAV